MKTRAELMAWLDEAEQVVTKYGWEDEITHPYYNCPTKVSKILRDCRDYDRCTRGSQEYLLQLATGFSEILAAWVKHAEEPKVKVRVKYNGKVVEVTKETAELMSDLVDEIEVE